MPHDEIGHVPRGRRDEDVSRAAHDVIQRRQRGRLLLERRKVRSVQQVRFCGRPREERLEGGQAGGASVELWEEGFRG